MYHDQLQLHACLAHCKEPLNNATLLLLALALSHAYTIQIDLLRHTLQHTFIAKFQHVSSHVIQ